MRLSMTGWALMLAACGGKHPGTYTTTETTAVTADNPAVADLIGQADTAWAARSNGPKLAQSLAAFEQVLEADPNNRYALEHLVRGWYFYGDAFSTDKAVKVERWGKAIAYGTRCLALNDDFRARIDAGQKEREAAEVATVADVPCLYWTASALGKWGKIQGLSKTLKQLPTVKAYIGKAEELDPTYWHYGPARYWGAYYSVLPSFAGRDLALSGQYFEASIEGAPAYLGTRVLRAEHLAVATEDIALFDADLQYVLDQDVSMGSPIGPENLKEQEKARRLVEERYELFPHSVIDAADAP